MLLIKGCGYRSHIRQNIKRERERGGGEGGRGRGREKEREGGRGRGREKERERERERVYTSSFPDTVNSKIAFGSFNLEKDESAICKLRRHFVSSN